jgi:nucleoside phosphorylase
LEEFGKYILLTNFANYIDKFAEIHKVQVVGKDRPMQVATANGISIINFGMGSPNGATIMDLLSALNPKACLFLGKCGGLKRKNNVGDLILPIAAIRGDGTSNDYFPPEGPEQYTPQTAAFGSTITNSKSTSEKSAQWLSTWKQQPYSALDFTTRSQRVHCSSSQISQWWQAA